jgi:MraZ protein
MATFIGEYACKVDVKGRIILPVAFKKQMPADEPDHFVVKKDIHEKCLVLYAMEDWNLELEKIRKRLNPYNREQNMIFRNFFRGTAELYLDNNNRFLIPKRLLELISAGRDVMLAGQAGRIEIWPEDIYGTTEIPADEYSGKVEKLLGTNINDPV